MANKALALTQIVHYHLSGRNKETFIDWVGERYCSEDPHIKPAGTLQHSERDKSPQQADISIPSGIFGEVTYQP